MPKKETNVHAHFSTIQGCSFPTQLFNSNFEVTQDKCIINDNGMFALIRLPGRFMWSFRNVFFYSAYMPPLPRYKPTPNPL